MVGDPTRTERGRPTHEVTARLRHSLIFRVAVAIHVAVIGVGAGLWLVEYRREQAAHFTEQIERLREEGRVLRAAQAFLETPAEFRAYIDAYCRQMARQVSPGHHIILRGPSGYIIARAHERANAALEREMIQTAEDGWRRFPLGDEPHVAVAVAGASGTTFVLSQSLAPVQRVIARLAINRAISIGAMTVILLAVSYTHLTLPTNREV